MLTSPDGIKFNLDDGNINTALLITSKDNALQTTVRTSADIELNIAGAQGINAESNTAVYASNHTIDMGKPFTWAIIADDGANITAENVSITSNGKSNVALATAGMLAGNSNQPSSMVFNNSSAKLSGETSIGLLGSGGKTELNNSTIDAEHGIVIVSDTEELGDNVIRLTDSKITGSKSLLQINPAILQDDGRYDYGEENGAALFNTTLTATRSQLHGYTDIEGVIKPKDGETPGKVSFNLAEQSTWALNADSTFDNLDLQNSNVVFTEDGKFKTLTLNGNLSGNGTFEMNAKLPDSEGDKLVVKGQADGKHILKVRNSKNDPTDKASLTLVQTAGKGNAEFTLQNAADNTDHIDLGAFRYTLKKEGGDWSLKYATQTQPATPTQPIAPTQPTTPTQPVTPVQPITPTQPVAPTQPTVPTQPTNPTALTELRVLSNYARHHLGDIQAAYQLEQQRQNTLLSRQVGLHRQNRSHGLWILGDYGRSRHQAYTDNHTAVDGLKIHSNGLQIGYDHAVGSGYIGALASQSRQNLHYGNHADSKLNAYGAGIYGGVEAGGWVADALYRYTAYRGKGTEDHSRMRAHSISLQGGRRIALTPALMLIPNAAVSYGWLSGSHVAEGTLLNSRIGADIQTQWQLGNVNIAPLAGVYYIGNHKKGAVQINNHRFETQSNHAAAARIGADIGFSPESRLGITLQTESGNRYRRPIWLEVGYRHTW